MHVCLSSTVKHIQVADMTRDPSYVNGIQFIVGRAVCTASFAVDLGLFAEYVMSERLAGIFTTLRLTTPVLIKSCGNFSTTSHAGVVLLTCGSNRPADVYYHRQCHDLSSMMDSLETS